MKKDSRYYRMIQSKRWRELRTAKLNVNPLCEVCLSKGLYVSASEIHHITPCETAHTDAEMERLMFSWSNLQSLCHACHQEAHRHLMSRSKEEIQKRNAARVARFAEKFLDRKEGGTDFIEAPQNDTNPLPQVRDKFSGFGKSVGGGVKQNDL